MCPGGGGEVGSKQRCGGGYDAPPGGGASPGAGGAAEGDHTGGDALRRPDAPRCAEGGRTLHSQGWWMEL